jgi:hypothetical protein
MIEQRVKDKLADLINRGRSLSSAHEIRNDQHFGQFEGWLVEANNAVRLAVPLSQNAYRQRMEKIADPDGKAIIRCVASATEILIGLWRDIEAGLLGNLSDKIRAEAFDDFLDHAEVYRQEDKKMEAGVICAVVFEDAVRRIYRSKIGDDKGNPLEQLINALATQGIISGQQSKQAKVAAHVRSKATHALWDEFDLTGIDGTIQITKTLLREHLGG